MSYVIDVTEATFEQEVLERSHEVPVVVDFWAEWCGPCRTLGPMLERLAEEAGGDWILAKVDVDANPGLASAFGVQGIPAVHAFRRGSDVAEFVGALPEQQVRDWLAGLGPTPADIAVQEGLEAEARGDLEAAAEKYRIALAHEPARAEAKAGLARAEVALRAASADENALRARVQMNPADIEAAMDLAVLEFTGGMIEAALQRMIGLVRASSGDERDRVRVRLLELLDTLAPDNPLALAARRDLAAALF